MSKTFRDWDVDQGWLLPPSLHDFVPSGHPAHMVRDLVRETLDLSAIFAVYVEARGRPPYHPAMMVALLLYAYSRGVYSSRKIARGCEERLDFMAVSGLQRPDFRTISDFRKRHLAALSGLFWAGADAVPASGLGAAWPCGAGRHQGQGQCLEAQGDELWSDGQGGGRSGGRGGGLAEAGGAGGRDRGCPSTAVIGAATRCRPGWPTSGSAWPGSGRPWRPWRPRPGPTRKPRPGADGEASGAPEAPPEAPAPRPPDKAQRNFTDPHSGILKTQDGFIQGYNAQAAADADHQVIVAHGPERHGQRSGPVGAHDRGHRGGDRKAARRTLRRCRLL